MNHADDHMDQGVPENAVNPLKLAFLSERACSFRAVHERVFGRRRGLQLPMQRPGSHLGVPSEPFGQRGTGTVRAARQRAGEWGELVISYVELKGAARKKCDCCLVRANRSGLTKGARRATGVSPEQALRRPKEGYQFLVCRRCPVGSTIRPGVLASVCPDGDDAVFLTRLLTFAVRRTYNLRFHLEVNAVDLTRFSRLRRCGLAVMVDVQREPRSGAEHDNSLRPSAGALLF